MKNKTVVIVLLAAVILTVATAKGTNYDRSLTTNGVVNYSMRNTTVYAHCGLWYRTPSVSGEWVTWNAGGHNPDRIVFEGWKRDVYTSTDYPLCGLFDSGEEEIHAWNIRLAKAAGISAFFAEPLPFQGISDYPYAVAFPALMRAANAENFKIAIFVDGRGYQVTDVDRISHEAEISLNEWKDDPAYLRINGKPVYILSALGAYPAWGWFTPENLTAFKMQVETSIHEPIYLIYEMDSWSKYPNAIPEAWWNSSAVDCFIRYLGWNDQGQYQFGNWTADQFKAEYLFDRSKAEAYGKSFIDAICPGFDDRQSWGNNLVPRERGQLFQRQIEAVKEANITSIMITNFDDWGEQTEIMPSLTYWNDWTNPFQYLSIVTQLTGKLFAIPNYPTTISDPIFQSEFQQIKEQFPPGT